MQNKVTQADRRLAFHLFSHVALPESAAKALRGEIDDNPIVKYASEARIAAAKEAEQAVLDRLRNLPDDVVAILRISDYEGTRGTAHYVRNIATALADALEGQPAAEQAKTALQECDLCVGECRGHRLGHPQEWMPEVGSRAHAEAEQDSQPAAGTERFRHKARGTEYTLIGVGRAQGSLSDEDPVVLYRGDDGSLWVRHQAEFCDGRFERVTVALAQEKPDA